MCCVQFQSALQGHLIGSPSYLTWRLFKIIGATSTVHIEVIFSEKRRDLLERQSLSLWKAPDDWQATSRDNDEDQIELPSNVRKGRCGGLSENFSTV